MCSVFNNCSVLIICIYRPIFYDFYDLNFTQKILANTPFHRESLMDRKFIKILSVCVV